LEEKEEIYRLFEILKINDIVKLNQKFFDYYNIGEDYNVNVKNETFLIINIVGNIIYLDKNVVEHNNQVHRIYLTKIKEIIKPTIKLTEPDIVVNKIKKEKKKKEVKIQPQKEIIIPGQISQPPPISIPSQPKHNYIIEDFKNELLEQNEFFETDNTDIKNKYFNIINKLKISNYEKLQLKTKIEKILKEI
jgi:hypothetical protein